MKKGITFLFFALCWMASVSAQLTISVDGVVVDGQGDPVEGVNVVVFTDSIFNWPGYYNISETDAAGMFSDGFDTPAGITQGTFFVGFEDCNGGYETIELAFSPGATEFSLTFLYCENGGGDPCSVTIEENPTFGLTAYPTGTAPYSYLWSTGETTSSITPNVPGTFCVTITDTNGCTAEDCYVYEPGGGMDSCFVYISVSGNDPFTLEAVATGIAPFTYTWNIGATTPSVSVSDPGDYCVTVTDATGCAATDCVTIQDPAFCMVTIETTPAGGLMALPTGGVAPYTFLWDTGETTPTIFPNQSGTYCVTIADANGCTAVACYNYTASGNSIFGYVYPWDSLNQQTISGRVWLIEYDDMAGTLTAVDSSDFGPTSYVGEYFFGDVDPGTYLIKAALLPGSAGYEDNMPTYYGNVLYWDEASLATAPNNTFYIISLQQGINPGGPGFIGGLVSEGANFVGGGDDRGGEGDPIANVSVLLLNQWQSPVTHTVTDGMGHFGFDNLAWGTYKLVVEIPGKEQGEKWVTIGPDNPSVEGIVFEINENNVTTGTFERLTDSRLTVFPNPASSTAVVWMESEADWTGTINMIRMDGRVVYSAAVQAPAGDFAHSLDVSDLQAGMYLIQITDGQQQITQRIVVK